MKIRQCFLMLQLKMSGMFFLRHTVKPELWAIEVYIERIGILGVFGSCDLDLDPITFLYELDSYSLEVHTCTNMNSLRQDFRNLSSGRHTDRQTESTEIINHAASLVVNKHKQGDVYFETQCT